MSKSKWSIRQRKAIEKVIRHYERILKDLQQKSWQITTIGCCPFCKMYYHSEIEDLIKCSNKCPNIVLTNTTCDYQSLIKRLVRHKANYRDGKRGSEKRLRKAILARIEFWKGQL